MRCFIFSLTAFILFSETISAQNVIGPAAKVAEDPSIIPGAEHLLQWGPVGVHPHVSYGLTYGTGIQSSPGNEEDSLIQTLTPGVSLNLGSKWVLEYEPSLTFYSNDEFDNSLNHRVNLVGGTTYEDWIFGFAQNYSLTSEPLVETAQQTDQETFSTGLSAGYQINSKASLNFGLSQDLRFAEGFNSSQQWTMTEGFFYQFWPRFGAGVSVTAGYEDVDLGSDMTFQSLQGQLRWRASEKTTFSASAGGELRQFLDVESDNPLNPVFSIIASHKPFEVTTVSLSASRGTRASYFNNEIVENTDLALSLSQRLFKHFQLSLNGGYRFSSYNTISRTLPTTREDTGYSFGASLSFSFLKRASITTFWNLHENSSDDGDFSFSSRQLGMQFSYGL